MDPPGSAAQANVAIYADIPGTDLHHNRAYHMAVSLAFDDRKLSMTVPVETARFFRPIAADAGL
jgi:hypothetical protein